MRYCPKCQEDGRNYQSGHYARVNKQLVLVCNHCGHRFQLSKKDEKVYGPVPEDTPEEPYKRTDEMYIRNLR